ncbi:low molecular weight protein arginine phosphatase [Cytobacillus solani]|uniref:Phosphatase n=1 Tax=Cytobacillus solani TaxID=1637975 RepID=A0A0Q3QUR4_9BACI|nr:low molecular weight protein arginine phosphatase [Cytobacillus solani]KQL21510.1 phosphatase [Cytobacillus solani]USK54817.1 low molecular weight protein arginine phosphatase [Cytobacillus solani]
MTRVLFVCTGNTCRSPMAEAILKSKNLPGIEVKSAGVYAMDGSAASENTRKVLAEHGIVFDSHQASMLNDELVSWTSYIITMTASHKAAVISMFPDAAGKIFTLKEFAIGNSKSDIADPFGGPIEQYRHTYNEMNDMMIKIIQRLQTENR